MNTTSSPIYHVYNRGTDKRIIFQDIYDYERFLVSLQEFNQVTPIHSLFFHNLNKSKLSRPTTQKKLVNILGYCLNPNHFHLLIQPLEENGMPEFMKRLGGGYTRYFNEKNKRTGALFQGKYKSKEIIDNDYLLHVSAYVILNNKIHNYNEETISKTQSSWESFINNQPDDICSGYEIIKDQFKNNQEIINYFNESVKNSKIKKEEDTEFAKALLE